MEQKFGVLSQGKKRFWIATLSAICFFCVCLICFCCVAPAKSGDNVADVVFEQSVSKESANAESVQIDISSTEFYGVSSSTPILNVQANQSVVITNCKFEDGKVIVGDGNLSLEGSTFSGVSFEASGTGNNNSLVFEDCSINGNGKSSVGALGTISNGFGSVTFGYGTTCENYGSATFDTVLDYGSNVSVHKWYKLECVVEGGTTQTKQLMSCDNYFEKANTVKTLDSCAGWFTTNSYAHVVEDDFGPAETKFPGEKTSIYTAVSNPSSNFLFEESGDGYMVSASSNFAVSGKLVFPAQYNNKPVHTIANDGFANKSNVTNIVLSSEIQTIEATAFDLTNISNLVISNKITSISNNVPFGRVLSTIVVDESNTVFDSRDNCNAIMRRSDNKLYLGCKNTIVPDSALSVGYGAFVFQTVNKTLDLKNVQTLDDYSFYSCNIASANLNSVKTIGNFAFCGSGLTSINLLNVVTIGDSSFKTCASLKTVVVGPKVETIGISSFTEDAAITSLVFEKNPSTGLSALTSIGNYAFQRCKSIPQVSIPCTVTTLGVSAFNTCEALKTVTFEKNSSTGKASLATIGSYAFKKCYVLESVTIPDSVTAINKEAFHSCSGLKTLIVGSGVETIGDAAFSETPNIETLSVNTSKFSISALLFGGCTKLKSLSTACSVEDSGFADIDTLENVTIQDTVTEIGISAFQNTGIKSLCIGTGVTLICADAFKDCSKINFIEFIDLVTLESIEFENEYSNPMFPVQGETTIINNTEIVSGVYLTIARAEIKPFTYAGFDALCDIRIDTAVQTIGVGAFLGCSGLNVVYATSNWLEIEFADWSSNPLAEANTKKLMIYYWSNGNQYLGDPTGKFSYYSDNTFDLDISNIGAVNPYAFYGCENIKRVLCGYQSDYVEIGNYAFAYSSVEELFLMNANWNLEYWAFLELVSSEFKCFLEMSLDATTPTEGYVAGSIAEALAEIFPNSSATTICFNSNDCGTEAGVLLAEMYAYYDMKISFFTGEGDNDFYFDGECIYADGIESRYPGGSEILAIPGYYLYSDASWVPVEAVMRGNNYSLYRLFIGEGVKHVYSGAFSNYNSLGVIILPETLETIGDYAFASSYYDHIFVPESVYYIGEHAFGSGSSGITVHFPPQFFEKFDDEEFMNEHGSFEECFPEFPNELWYDGEGYCEYSMDRRTYFRAYYFG